jgi:large subunit ribosomal protein L5
LGLKEHTIFPEMVDTGVGTDTGMDISFVTSARNNAEARELLMALGVPFVGK